MGKPYRCPKCDGTEITWG